MLRQRTLKNAIRATGVGLHTGEKVCMTLRPAPVDTGIVFRRIDLTEPVDIPRDAENVGDTMLGTTLDRATACKVSTVEHLMSAFAGLGIDNAYVDLSAAEVPIMDGSAGPFVFLLQSAGIEEQNAPKRFIRIRSASRCRTATSGRASSRTTASASTSRSTSTIRCSSDAVAARDDGFLHDRRSCKEVSRARTFGFMHDLEYMRERNLGARRHRWTTRSCWTSTACSTRTACATTTSSCRHKILDAIGDLYLLGPRADRRVLRLQVRPRAQQPAAARAAGRQPALGRSHLRRRRSDCADFLRSPRPATGHGAAGRDPLHR